jgi:hypothetical protein
MLNPTNIMDLSLSKKLKPLNKYLNQKNFEFTETIDMDKFKIIIDNFNETMGLMRDSTNGYNFIDLQGSLTILKKIYDERLDSNKISYKQTKSSPDGRFFSITGSLQGISRRIRHTIGKDIYYDIDIKNCHPVILLWYCKNNGIECKSVEYYINNREKCFADLMPVFNLDRDSIKSGLLSIMNGGFGFKNVEKCKELWFIDFYNEMIGIHKAIVEMNPDILKTVISQKGKDYYNLHGSVVNKILCKYENFILLHMMYFCEKKNVRIGALCFDGLMIYKNSIDDLNSFLVLMTEFVKEKTGIPVKIVDKDMNEHIDLTGMRPNISIVRYSEKKNDYSSMKEEFEKTHFKCVGSGLYYEIKNDSIKVRTRTDLLNSYEHMVFEDKDKKGHITELPFINAWVKDKNIRRFDEVELYPPPLHCPENHFNLWTGYRIDKVSLDDLSPETYEFLDDALETYLNHFKLITGECFDYCLKWYALMIQKPGIKPNVCINIKSLQGLGKEMGGYTPIEKIFGSKYCLKTQDMNVIFGPFNNAIEGKIFVCLDEMNMGISAKLEEEIKVLITTGTTNINNKGIKSYEAKSLIHLVSFSNRDFPFKIPEDDRRNIAVDRSDISVPGYDYFNKLISLIDNDLVIRKIFDFFMAIDISDFKPKEDRPKTAFMDELKEISRPLELQFLIDLFDQVNHDFEHPSKELLKLFGDFLKENFTDIKYPTSANKLSLRIGKFKIDGADKVHTRDGALWSFQIDKCKEWCYSKNYLQRPLLK